MKITRKHFIALAAVSAAFAAAATDIYVSPRGDDSSDGSIERPFATVGRARDAVRAMKKSANEIRAKIMKFFVSPVLPLPKI